MTKPRRDFYWKWPSDGQAWFAWAFQNYGSKWIVWRVGPLNYRVQVAEPGQNGGWIRRVRSFGQDRTACEKPSPTLKKVHYDRP